MTGSRVVLTIAFCMAASAPLHCQGDTTRPSKLLRILIGRSEAARMQAVNQIKTNPQAVRQSLDDLVSAAKRNAGDTARDELVRPSTIAMMYVIGGVDSPDSESLLIDLLDVPHVGIAMVSADVLGSNKFYGAIEFLKKQVDRAEYETMYGFRFNLVRSLAQMEHPDAVDFLTELRTSLDGQLRFQLERLLEEVTVSHFLGDEERFGKWKSVARPRGDEGDEVDAENRKSIFTAANFTPESLDRVRLERQQYYGIDIHAERLMFIIDHSGSMRQYWGGMTRLERAKGELIRAITELPENSEFAIMFYHTYVKQWRDELVPATEENKQEAVQFVRRLAYGNRTNTYGALRRSLEFDDELEAVFLLTDGRPTAGNIIAPPSIVTDILQRNRFRHLNFNTIGIAVGGPTEAFLRQLAEETNGEFRKAN